MTSPTRQPLGDDIDRKIQDRHPDTKLPGYWDTLATNCTTWSGEISAGPFWRAAVHNVALWSNEYAADRGGADLLQPGGLRNFSGKSKSSVQDKIVRECRRLARRKSLDPVIDAIIGANPPIPMINDLVRTRVVCKYLDGVEFLGTKFVDLAKSHMLHIERVRLGSLQGYFAQHLYIKQPVYYRVLGGAQPATIQCEIQIGTELSTHLWDLQHGLYERHRGQHEQAESWQWDSNDPRFISHQLGHMLHLADGLMVQLRRVSRGEKP